MGKAASLNPETFNEGGGLIDDIDVTLEKVRFEIFDYNGKGTPAPSMAVTMSSDDLDEEMIQYYSMGNAKDWMPSEDGTQLLAVGSATAIRMSTNGGIFLKVLMEAGFPADQLGEDISVLDGLKAHVIRIPAPKRNIAKTKEQQEKEDKYGPPTILVVGEILEMPGEGGKKSSSKKSSSKKSSSKKTTTADKKSTTKKEEVADDEGGDVEGKSIEFIMNVLSEDGEVAKKSLPQKAFKMLKDDPDRNAIVKKVFEDDFLNSGPWEFDGTTISLG